MVSMDYVEQVFRKLVEEFSNYYGVRIEIRGTVQHLSKILTVDVLRVQKNRRGEGLGNHALLTLTQYADAIGWRMAVRPRNEFGSSEARLTAWLKRHGFRPCRSSRRDMDVDSTYTMVRDALDGQKPPVAAGDRISAIYGAGLGAAVVTKVWMRNGVQLQNGFSPRWWFEFVRPGIDGFVLDNTVWSRDYHRREPARDSRPDIVEWWVPVWERIEEAIAGDSVMRDERTKLDD
ncbi:hypothetical protein ABT246_24450 [Streptomyces sp. NPDC001553]|uniref:hypothetical protein n=1 Tax=Streptomyces sp. NPDC001553 TaxID=3154385 RepID=UPI003319953E